MKQLRLTLKTWEKQLLTGTDRTGKVWQVTTATRYAQQLHNRCQPGDILQLLELSQGTDGCWHAARVICDPDYLIDISSLSACFTESGAHPFHYLLDLLTPKDISHYILLGNTANQFLDDAINETPDHCITYQESIGKSFRNDSLKFTVCPHIDAGFFTETKRQYANIREAVEQLHKRHPLSETNTAYLEPSFICPLLGLQGRLDYLQQNCHCLVELKSGKCDEAGGQARTAKKSHTAQMMLYREMLHLNCDIPREDITGYLLYSRYPRYYRGEAYPDIVDEALMLRNDIVLMLHYLRTASLADTATFFEGITPTMLNTAHLHGRLWDNYIEPQLQRKLQVFHTHDVLGKVYFYRYLHFILQEQFVAKTGTGTRNNACNDLWLLSDDEKMANGDLIDGLYPDTFKHEEGYDSMSFTLLTSTDAHVPNFRKGDLVLFYGKEKESDSIISQQIYKGTLIDISEGHITIGLKQHQRGAEVFYNRRYAMEHDASDSVFTGLYKGLYQLLRTTPERRALFLGQRLPQTDTSIAIQGHYLNERIDDIVRTVRQSTDYTLIVGAPGAGKTSIVLRSIVEEYFHYTQENILLMAYTNRAVDEICEALEHLSPTPDYIRLGSEQSCEKSYVHRTLSRLTSTCHNRDEVRALISNTRIFVSTVSTASMRNELFEAKQFGIAIIDEASQILEPQLATLLTGTLTRHASECVIKQFVLIGDHKQLPAVVVQSDEDAKVTEPELLKAGIVNCKQSLFERLYNQLRNADANECITTLNRQGRMHPDVCDFANKHFYGGRLEAIPLPHQEATLPFVAYDRHNPWQLIVATRRTAFIPIKQPVNQVNPKSNNCEATIVAQLVEAIISLYEINHVPFDSNRTIGIIAPFRAQGACIRQALEKLELPETNDITIDTVERYQGSQRDIIIYCTTISNASQLDQLVEVSEQEGEHIDRKLNVALTRARNQLFVTGIPNVLCNDDTYAMLMKEL